MDTQNTEGKADKTRSGPATGYATAVDAALHLATSGFTCARFQTSAKALGVLACMKNGDIYSEVAAKVLAEEVLRLRASAALREEIIEECARAVETQVRGTSYQWLGESLFARLVAKSAQRVRSLKSHNEVAHPRASGKETQK